jgi:hypothetical protein
MALTPLTFQKKPQSGGGGLGSVLGGILGAIAAPFTAGASIPIAAAGMSIGSTAGGLIGGAAAPGKGGGQGMQLQQSAIARRAEAPNPSQVLEQSLAALKDTTPDIQEAYGAPLMKAYEMSRKRGF